MADGVHLSREILARFLEEEPDDRVTAAVLGHLSSGCERCAAELLALHEPAPGRYDFTLARARRRGGNFYAAIDQSRMQALDRFLRILHSVAGGPQATPLQGWAWCELLLGAAHVRRGKDLRGALLLAAMAAAKADLLIGHFPARELADLQARAWAEVGNLQRIANELDLADHSLRTALERMDAGTGDDLLFAQILDFYGSLYRAQRRFPEANRALDRATFLYLRNGERHLAGRILVTKGVALNYADQPAQAQLCFQAALPCLDQARDPELLFTLVHNSLIVLADLGEYESAARLLWRFRRNYKERGGLDAVRLLGLEAKVAAGLGQTTRAERLFREGLGGFEQADLPYDAALAALDLAALLVEHGRPAEVVALIDRMLAEFLQRGILREVCGALLVLRDTAAQGAATVATVRAAIAAVKAVDREALKAS